MVFIGVDGLSKFGWGVVWGGFRVGLGFVWGLVVVGAGVSGFKGWWSGHGAGQHPQHCQHNPH